MEFKCGKNALNTLRTHDHINVCIRHIISIVIGKYPSHDVERTDKPIRMRRCPKCESHEIVNTNL